MRRAGINQRRRVLRAWRLAPGFATYHCARCGEHGFTRDLSAPPPDPFVLARAQAEAAERERVSASERLRKARWLWSQRRPMAHTIGEVYLRDARGYGGPLPATLGFLPPRGEHGPAMIAAFGIAYELRPGIVNITDSAVTGIHITRLAPDAAGKAGTEHDKIMIGRSAGSPIMLAPPNDLLGLAIVEGIEDGLSVHEATGLDMWIAGCASRLSALAATVPSYIDSVTVVADADDAGQRHAGELVARLHTRGIDAHLITPGAPSHGGLRCERPRYE
jgi:hypothetical protein